MKESLSPERYQTLLQNELILRKYAVFIKAKRLGIIFSPRDIDIELLNSFDIIDTEINKSTRTR